MWPIVEVSVGQDHVSYVSSSELSADMKAVAVCHTGLKEAYAFDDTLKEELETSDWRLKPPREVGWPSIEEDCRKILGKIDMMGCRAVMRLPAA
jgi:hypothetical protein